MANAKSVIENGSLSGSFTDVNGSVVSFNGLKGKALDYAMVQYEQTKVQDFIDKYKKDNSNVNMDKVMKLVSESMGSRLAPSELYTVMKEHFDKGKSFNFNKYDDRVKLGQKIIDLLHEKKK